MGRSQYGNVTRVIARGLTLVTLCSFAGSASADTFGSGANQFSIDFVTLPANPGETRSTNTSGDVIETFTAGVGISEYIDPGYDYRVSVFEVTNDQWNKFQVELGMPVTGDPPMAYDETPVWTGANVPTANVSWYEAAQFVNWLNTSNGHQPAYKFTGTQGQGDYALDTWSPAEAYGGTNLYRHKDAFYYLPTEDEWVKAAYWNGSDIQTWATPDDDVPQEDIEANFLEDYPSAPWDVGDGSLELNGTFDMMGNAWEWMEGPYSDSSFGADEARELRGGSFGSGPQNLLDSSYRHVGYSPSNEGASVGFRVASEVPEPCTLTMLAAGLLGLIRRR